MGQRRAGTLAAVALAAACGGSSPAPSLVITRDSVEAVHTVRRGAPRPTAPPAAERPRPAPSVPDSVDDGRPLLVTVYDPDLLDRLNWGDVPILLDRVMAYVGETGAPGGVSPFGDDTDPWVNRLAYQAGREEAHAIVRDTAAALGIAEGDRYWVVGPAGSVEAVLTTARPGRDMCARPGGVAFAVGGPAAVLPAGSYYATSDSAAAARMRVRPPEEAGPRAPPATLAALDTDGDGVVDTVLGNGWLRQGRDGGREYWALDPSHGLC